MQTFITNPSDIFDFSALDNKRLGKQRVEALQIYQTLYIKGPKTPEGKFTPWYNHPATQLWTLTDKLQLVTYLRCSILEWKKRGFKNTIDWAEQYNNAKFDSKLKGDAGDVIASDKFAMKLLSATHRSNLWRKAPEHYSQFSMEGIANLLYWWPTKQTAEDYIKQHPEVEKFL